MVPALLNWTVVCGILYFPIWMDFKWYQVSWISGLVFGTIIGIFGIAGWTIMFWLSPKHPPVSIAEYFLQLFLAHIVFGLTTVASHWMVGQL